jgi:anti-sigma B factor antagonist
MFRLARNTSQPVSPAGEAPVTSTTVGPASFHVVEDAAAGHPRLHLRGELDLAAAPVLREHVRSVAARDGSVTLDLSGVAFIDVAGLCALTTLAREAGEQGWSLDLCNPSLSVRRLVRLTSTDGLFAA